MRPPTADRSVTPISMSNEHEAATAIATEEGLHHRDSWKFDIRKFTEDGGISNQNIETTLSLNPPPPTPGTCSIVSASMVALAQIIRVWSQR